MKRFAFVITAGLLLSTAAFAADAPAPAPAPTAPVNLTADEMNVVSAAMNKVAATCATDPDGCVIGMRNKPIQEKLIAAFRTFAPAPAKK